MSHSKRNTSRAVFTSYERDLARRSWGSSTARLSRESFLPFASCGLCLSPAADPVACGARGDVFCRECALGNLLAQRREAERLRRARAAGERDRAEAGAREDEEARRRAVRDFEMTMQGLDGGGGGSGGSAGRKGGGGGGGGGGSETLLEAGWGSRSNHKNNNNNNHNNGVGGGDNDSENGSKRPPKRKLETLDAEELARAAAEEDRAKARRLLDSERAEAAAKATLPSFWTPSMTPSGSNNATATTTTTQEKDKLSSRKDKKANNTNALPVCPASRPGDPHPYTLHTLVTINFTEEDEEEGGSQHQHQQQNKVHKQKRRVCPACRKGLSNASKAVLAKPCGHVLCRSCVDRFMRPGAGSDPHHAAAPHHHGEASGALRCYVCDEDLTDRPPPPPKKNNGDDGGDNDDKGDGKQKKKKREKEKEKEKERIRPGLVELRSEGTGFSAAGSNEVKKNGVAFQC